MKLHGMTISVVLLATSVAVAANKPVDRSHYHHAATPPHYPAQAKPANVKAVRRSTTVPNTVSSRGGSYNAEVVRLEQATSRAQTRSQHSAQRTTGRPQAAHADASPRASGINFSYHPPQAGVGRAGGHHH
jgi:hypothetical protein